MYLSIVESERSATFQEMWLRNEEARRNNEKALLGKIS